MISGTHLEPSMPRRIRDTYTGEVFWWCFKDRSYHDQANSHSYPPSRFLNYAGHLSANYEEGGMNIEIGTKVFFKSEPDGLTVTNIRIGEFGELPEVYFDNGESMSSAKVFEYAEAWG